jgi:hypothetical protein
MAREECARFASGLHWVVREVAITDASSVIALREHLGWGGYASQGGPAEHWNLITGESVTRDALTVVLPDNAEQTGEEHPWAEFVATLDAAGVASSEAELAAVPYAVVFAPRLREALAGASGALGYLADDLS